MSVSSACFIITNSTCCWVRWCCETFMPETEEFLRLGAVKVVSARDAFSEDCPNSKGHWKRLVFDCIRRKLLEGGSHCFWNIVVIGDSDLECKAVQSLSAKMANKSCCKSVRLGSIQPKELVKQQSCLTNLLVSLAETKCKPLTAQIQEPFCKPQFVTGRSGSELSRQASLGEFVNRGA